MAKNFPDPRLVRTVGWWRRPPRCHLKERYNSAALLTLPDGPKEEYTAPEIDQMGKEAWLAQIRGLDEATAA
jgi:hypothetical protein